MSKIALYPGSFDPFTNGHLQIVQRAKKIFDNIIIMVADNSQKKDYVFTPNERKGLIESVFINDKNIKVIQSHDLTINIAREYKVDCIIRGLRQIADFEMEFQLSDVNYHLDKNIEMIYFFSRGENTYISSSTIKELFFHNVDISNLVPTCVLEALKNKYKK